MSLRPGSTIGSFTIVSKLGEGGMGEVYRAHDTRLGRDVAIKILPEAFAADADRLARFEREAKALAALNHPNIAGIHGLEERPTEAGGTMRALVMELVEGEDLSAQIARGRMAPSDALPIAHQIAAALEAAHEQGIVHRDLKPANIKVRADATVKVLDFGLAKAMEPGTLEPSNHGPLANSPTLTARATQMGMILGTAAYMAPEQARGRPVDRRADVWAFGAVLFEMLTGKRAFPGEDITDTLAAVVRAEPNWSLLPAGLPSSLVLCLRRCLEKDPKQRIPDIATMRLALDGAFETSVTGDTHLRPRSPQRLVWAFGLLAAASILVAAISLLNQPAAQGGSAARLVIPLPTGAELTSYPAISRDGRTIAYVGRQGTEAPQLYLRSIDAFESRLVAGSAGARQPFFSPDGKWVGFFASGQMVKVEVAGGSPIKIAEAVYPYGAAWMDDHTIIYVTSLGSGLWQVSDAGYGVPKQLTKPDGAANGYANVFPHALPGGQNVLFGIWGKERGVAVLSLASGTWQMVMPQPGFATATYDVSSGTPSGRLLSVDAAANIRVAPFDPAHPAPTNPEATVLDNVYSDIENESMGWLAISETGTAVYAAGNPAKASLVWLGADGAVTPVTRKQDLYREVSVSPDGKKAAIRLGLDLWIHDLTSGTNAPLTARANSNILPVWTADSQRVVYGSNRAGDWDIYSQPVNGSKPAEVVLKKPGDQFPYSFAPDGTLLWAEISAGGRDLWTLSPGGKASPLRVTPANEYAAVFSPEPGGPRWIAYTSDESGRPEIYVQSYPGGERRTPVSSGGGVRPMWSSDGRELYFFTGEALVAATMQPNGTFGVPRRLADRASFHVNDRFSSFSPAPGAKRLLMIHRDEGSVPRQLNVILNWNRPGR